jgi:hypothetical protein|uniref:hypothetical protein n=1 Tax=unclassified Variovorax TaxID=663243 RepID=UPI000D3A8EAD
MAGGSVSSREQNFWPGFVDALTNVVLVMVFVVVVFAIAMFGAMLKVSKVHVAKQVELQTKQQSEAVQVVAQQALVDVAQARAEAAAAGERTEQLRKENQRLSEALQRAAPQASGAAAAQRRVPQAMAPVAIFGRSPAIDVSYALGVTSLEKKLLDALDVAMGSFEGAARWEVSLQATMAEPTPSEARRLAFYRLAVVRDHLVAKGVAPERISVVIQDARSSDDRSHVLIRWRDAP